jgi:integrase
MASVVRLGEGKDLRFAIDFMNLQNRKKRLYLTKADKDGNAEVTLNDAKNHAANIQNLIDARRVNRELNNQTIAWLGDLSASLFEKLEKFGLAESRPVNSRPPTLCDWLDKYIDQRRPELDLASVERLERTANRLKLFFANNPRIDELTPDDAANWRASMIAEKRPLDAGWKTLLDAVKKRLNDSGTWTGLCKDLATDCRCSTDSVMRRVKGLVKEGRLVVSKAGRMKTYAIGEVEPKPNLGETTIRNYSRDAKTIFNAAVDREIIPRNPFAKLKSAVQRSNKDGYVNIETAAAVLNECHDIQWKVIFALGRFAGLRTPSETHRLTWDNVNWEKSLLTVYAPKTKSTRIVPIVADLLGILREAYFDAPERATRIVTLSGHRSNLHRGLEKIICRAGVAPWDDLFQTLRVSAEVDFKRHFPESSVLRWIGHSGTVSSNHYSRDDAMILQAATSAPSLIERSKNIAEVAGNGQKTPEVGENSTLNMISENEENPCKTRVFDSSEGGTRTRDPRLMKPVL